MVLKLGVCLVLEIANIQKSSVMCVCVHVHACVYMYVSACVRMCLCVRLCVCIHVYVCVYMCAQSVHGVCVKWLRSRLDYRCLHHHP